MNAMHACEMTLTYLRGALATCSVVWVHFRYFFLKFINNLMQLCKNIFRTLKNRLIPSLSRAVYACATLFPESVSVALVCDFKFCRKNDDFSRCFVNFERFEFLNRYTFC